MKRNYFKDKHLDRNKIIIKDALREILNEVKKEDIKTS